MKTVLLEIEDSKFEQFMIVMNSLKSDLITKFQVQKVDDEFKIDEEQCLEVLEKINRGDFTGMKSVSSDELFKELGL
jgi:hypothetical protein